jgi:N-acetylmuramoyl-L-alanine amidase
LQDVWYYDDNHKAWYYLNDECKMVRGSKEKALWKWIDGKCYAFGENGKMYCDCVTPYGGKVNADGVWIN